MNSKVKRLCECSIMIALASVLSLCKLVDFPYGGSVTLVSMLPILLIAYRHGTGVGVICGLAYGALQQLLGLNTLTYASTPAAVIAIILLDYLLAFAVIGLGGLCRRLPVSAPMQLACGAVLGCLLRYSLHVIAGATVWAGLSIPTEAALFYSLGYNATYMIPETMLLIAVAAYLGATIDFRAEIPTPVRRESAKKGATLLFSAVFSAAMAVVVPVVLLFLALQNGESGAFDVSGLVTFDYTPALVCFAIFFALALVLFLVAAAQNKKSKDA